MAIGANPNKTNNRSHRQKIAQLREQIIDEIGALCQKDRYERLLAFMSNFLHYSLENIMLAWVQYPEASTLKTYGDWSSEYSRVPKSEAEIGDAGKAILLLETALVEANQEQPDMDETGDGMVEPNEDDSLVDDGLLDHKEYKSIIQVYDILQTKEKARRTDTLKIIVNVVDGNEPHFVLFSDAIIKSGRSKKVIYVDASELPDTNKVYDVVIGSEIMVKAGMDARSTIISLITAITEEATWKEKMNVQPHEYELIKESIVNILLIHFKIVGKAEVTSFVGMEEIASDEKYISETLSYVKRISRQLADMIRRNFVTLCKKEGLEYEAERTEKMIISKIVYTKDSYTAFGEQYPKDEATIVLQPATQERIDEPEMPQVVEEQATEKEHISRGEALKSSPSDETPEAQPPQQESSPIPEQSSPDDEQNENKSQETTVAGQIEKNQEPQSQEEPPGKEQLPPASAEKSQQPLPKIPQTYNADTDYEVQEAFLKTEHDCFIVLQIRPNPKYRDIRNQTISALIQRGKFVVRATYKIVYFGIPEYNESPINVYDRFVKYERHEYPEDFTGDKITVSTVFCFKINGNIQSYYVDVHGGKSGLNRLNTFLGEIDMVKPDENSEKSSAATQSLTQESTKQTPQTETATPPQTASAPSASSPSSPSATIVTAKDVKSQKVPEPICKEEEFIRECAGEVFKALKRSNIEGSKYDISKAVTEVLAECDLIAIRLTIALHTSRMELLTMDAETKERSEWATDYLMANLPFKRYGGKEVHGLEYIMSPKLFDVFTKVMYNRIKQIKPSYEETKRMARYKMERKKEMNKPQNMTDS